MRSEKLYVDTKLWIDWDFMKLSVEEKLDVFQKASKGTKFKEHFFLNGVGRKTNKISHWQKLRREAFEHDEYTCQYCGKTNVILHCDHIIPKSRGGKNCFENLITACSHCNLTKGNKTLTEWLSWV